MLLCMCVHAVYVCVCARPKGGPRDLAHAAVYVCVPLPRCVCACKHRRACARANTSVRVRVCVCVHVCMCACVQVPFSVCVLLCSLAAHVLMPLYRDRADANRPGPHWIIDCLAAPSAEPSYPLAR
jgi:hypothetical protein